MKISLDNLYCWKCKAPATLEVALLLTENLIKEYDKWKDLLDLPLSPIKEKECKHKEVF
jgi:hypothetical protein